MVILQKLFFLLIFLFINSVFSVSYADSSSETLSTLLRNMHSMQADFVQTMLDKKGKSIQKATGHMSLQRPSQFRWETIKPNHQLMVTNGKRLWIYDPDLEQVTIRTLVRAAGSTPAMLLSDEDLSLGKEFTVQSVKSSSPLQWFLLIPKDKGSSIASMKMGFMNQQIQQMELQDHLGHITHIEFNHINTNLKLAASLFHFKPPAHIDVIDETKSRH